MAPGNLVDSDGNPIGGDSGDGSSGESATPESVAPEGDAPAGSIQTDDSWKEEAQREKEKLGEEALDESPRELPPASFLTVLSDLGFQAMFALGLVGSEESTERVVDLQAAKYTVDTLSVLEEKTRGNLTEEEASTLEQMLHSLRMRFVEVQRLVAEQLAKQAQEAGIEQGAPEGEPPGGSILGK